MTLSGRGTSACTCRVASGLPQVAKDDFRNTCAARGELQLELRDLGIERTDRRRFFGGRTRRGRNPREFIRSRLDDGGGFYRCGGCWLSSSGGLHAWSRHGGGGARCNRVRRCVGVDTWRGNWTAAAIPTSDDDARDASDHRNQCSGEQESADVEDGLLPGGRRIAVHSVQFGNALGALVGKRCRPYSRASASFKQSVAEPIVELRDRVDLGNGNVDVVRKSVKFDAVLVLASIGVKDGI